MMITIKRRIRRRQNPCLIRPNIKLHLFVSDSQHVVVMLLLIQFIWIGPINNNRGSDRKIRLPLNIKSP
jgi:hypothetical protein